MKEYTFEDTDNEGYDIVVPREVVNKIITDYREKTFYVSLSITFMIIGFLLGLLVK